MPIYHVILLNVGCNEFKIILPEVTCGKIWQWYNLLHLLLETSGKGLHLLSWLSMCGCLDEWISDRNNLLKALCLRDLRDSWKKIVTVTYSIKIRPHKFRRTSNLEIFFPDGWSKMCKQGKVIYKTSPYETASRNRQLWS